MTNQQIGKILTQIINEQYPGIDMRIFVKSEPNMIYLTIAKQLI